MLHYCVTDNVDKRIQEDNLQVGAKIWCFSIDGAFQLKQIQIHKSFHPIVFYFAHKHEMEN